MENTNNPTDPTDPTKPASPADLLASMEAFGLTPVTPAQDAEIRDAVAGIAANLYGLPVSVTRGLLAERPRVVVHDDQRVSVERLLDEEWGLIGRLLAEAQRAAFVNGDNAEYQTVRALRYRLGEIGN